MSSATRDYSTRTADTKFSIKTNNTTHHLAIKSASPTLHAPSARDSTRMLLHRMSQNLRPIHHEYTKRISLKTHCPPSVVSIILHTLTTIKPTRRQQTKNPTRSLRTPPKAIDATPLLNPTTETGVERPNVELSPS